MARSPRDLTRGSVPRCNGRSGGVASDQRSSRCVTIPASMARWASWRRFWLCGRSGTANLRKSARRCVLTPSTERYSSAAICWLVAGAANAEDSANGRHRRHEHALLHGGELEHRVRVAGDARGRRRAAVRVDERDHGAPGADEVAVREPPPARQPLAGHERPVLGQPVVHDRPLAADALDDRVQAGDLGVPVERDVVLRRGARSSRARRRRAIGSAAPPPPSRQTRNGASRPLGLQPRAQLLGRRAVRCERGFHGPTLPRAKFADPRPLFSVATERSSLGLAPVVTTCSDSHGGPWTVGRTGGTDGSARCSRSSSLRSSRPARRRPGTRWARPRSCTSASRSASPTSSALRHGAGRMAVLRQRGLVATRASWHGASNTAWFYVDGQRAPA